MIKKNMFKEFYNRAIYTNIQTFLYEEYHEKLLVQLQLWIGERNPYSERIIEEAIYNFNENSESYYFETDCYIAIVGCMREVAIEYMFSGKISVENGCLLLRKYYRERKSIRTIEQKQLNIVLSKFNRKMFDYFVNRYFFLKDIAYDKQKEKKIEKLFKGKGNLWPLYAMNRFQAATCSESAYVHYVGLIHPLFIEQIDKGKSLCPHPDVNEHYRMQIMSNTARLTLPVYAAVGIGLLIMKWLGLF